MNILFLLKSLYGGGIEVVTRVLANKFVKEGHNVTIWCFLKDSTSLENKVNEQIRIYYGNGFQISPNNILQLRKILIQNKIDIVINQKGLPFIPIITIKLASIGLKTKIISVYHSDPSANGRILSLDIRKPNRRSFLINNYQKIKYRAIKYITSMSMEFVYHCSNKYILLSNNYINKFRDFTKMTQIKKISIIANPVTKCNNDFSFENDKKEKNIIFVGRIDCNKRIDRIIESWNLLYGKYPKWHLLFVGDGPKKEEAMRLAKELNIKSENMHFEGFTSPIPYYEKASILLLTSDFEGFPLVLTECMSYGVIPIVYGSFNAVYDIIDDNKDGYIIPYSKEKGFVAKDMAEKIEFLINNDGKRNEMALAAIEKSKKFSIETIYKKWEELLLNLRS